MKDIEIVIAPDGTVQHIYDDRLAGAFEGEQVEVRRASNVEPAGTFGVLGGGWLADMRPVGGPLLGAGNESRDGLRGYQTRQAALDAEVEWLRAHMAAATL